MMCYGSQSRKWVGRAKMCPLSSFISEYSFKKVIGFFSLPGKPQPFVNNRENISVWAVLFFSSSSQGWKPIKKVQEITRHPALMSYHFHFKRGSVLGWTHTPGNRNTSQAQAFKQCPMPQAEHKLFFSSIDSQTNRHVFKQTSSANVFKSATVYTDCTSQI